MRKLRMVNGYVIVKGCRRFEVLKTKGFIKCCIEERTKSHSAVSMGFFDRLMDAEAHAKSLKNGKSN